MQESIGRRQVDFERLREKVLINATGDAERALFSDQSITPALGQIGGLSSGAAPSI